MGASVDFLAPRVTRGLRLGMGWCDTLARTRRTMRRQGDIRLATDVAEGLTWLVHLVKTGRGCLFVVAQSTGAGLSGS